MPTLGYLKEKLARDIDAEDGFYNTDIADAIDEAIAFYSKNPYWFSEQEFTVPLVIGREYYDGTNNENIPLLQRVYNVWHQQTNGNRYELDRVYNDEISQSSNFTNGAPTCFSVFNRKLRIYPPSDEAASIVVYGWVKRPAPPTDNDSNEWTNEAFWLIYNRARSELAASTLSDGDEAAKFKLREQETLLSLMGENDDMQRTGYIEGTVT